MAYSRENFKVCVQWHKVAASRSLSVACRSVSIRFRSSGWRDSTCTTLGITKRVALRTALQFVRRRPCRTQIIPIQIYRSNQWNGKVCATAVSTVLFCYSSVRHWWRTSLCFSSWSSQWAAPLSAPHDRVFTDCLNTLDFVIKILRGITYSCGGEYARYVLLGCDTAMRYCRNANLQSIRDAGNRFFWNVCDFRPHYMTSHHRRGNIQDAKFSAIILELKTCSFAFKALYYIASNVIW